MKTLRYGLLALAIIAINAVGQAQISITATGISYTENFDSLGANITATLPSSWRVDRNDSSVRTVGTFSGAGTATSAIAGNNLATNASAAIYNFGSGVAASATDRAIGFLSTGSAVKSGNIYAYFQNNTGSNISSFSISYDIEKYRQGTNAAGYSVQMYYSTNGSTWTSAGSGFLTSYLADASNSGYASAPGASSSITGSALNLSIASGSSLYLAWNYSVSSGSTATNAQALALDNFSIAAVAIPEPSTYAAILGCAALTGVLIRRRRLQSAA